MAGEKVFEASKQAGKQQKKFTDELLTEDELDNVTGGTNGNEIFLPDENELALKLARFTHGH